MHLYADRLLNKCLRYKRWSFPRRYQQPIKFFWYI